MQKCKVKNASANLAYRIFCLGGLDITTSEGKSIKMDFQKKCGVIFSHINQYRIDLTQIHVDFIEFEKAIN